MGLPNINIEFSKKAISAIKRSSRGIVALILKDSTEGLKEYNSITDIKENAYSADNMDYITKTMLGCPNKLLVATITDKQTVADALNLLKNKKWNYAVMPEGTESDNTTIATFIKEQRKNKKTFKAVLAQCKADSEGVINFTSYNIKVKDKFYNAQQYTCRIAGILAGLSLNRSATYYVLSEVEDVVPTSDANTCIDDGQLILINDGEKVKIARAVNSLTTLVTGKTEDFKKIKIVEGMDLVQDDITTTFSDVYTGKIINNYDNKMLLVTAINAYFKTIAEDNVLDINYDNRARVDGKAQELYLQKQGIKTDNMSKQELKECNTGSNVFLAAKVKFVDAMEDLAFAIEI